MMLYINFFKKLLFITFHARNRIVYVNVQLKVKKRLE